jgi:hypothetical protein
MRSLAALSAACQGAAAGAVAPLFEVGNNLIQVSLGVVHPAIGETLAPFDFAN